MNNSQNYNQGMSFFGNYVTPEKEQDANADQHQANNQYQSFAKSGYSNASSPDTSSRSSSNSQCCSQSLENFNVDSLINTLLQVVNSDTFNPPNSCNAKCIQLSQNGMPVKNRCNDCTDTLCNSCSNRILNPPESSKENEYNYNTPEMSSPIMNIPNVIPPRLPFYCDLHRDGQKFYCQTCSKPFCVDCEFHFHHVHVTINLMDAIEGAGIQANQVLKEARLGITILREELDAIQIAAEILEQKARQAAADVMLCVRRVASALEAREKELLGRIEKAKLIKFSALKARDEGIRIGISRLTRAADKLTEAMESKVLASNPLNLFLTKDMASAENFHMAVVAVVKELEIFRIHQSQQSLPSQEENWISFSGLENTIMNAIANLGAIAVNNPGPVGDRRPVRGRGNSPQLFLRQIASSAPVPKGRPIPSNSYPVVVRMDRSAQSSVTPLRIIGNDGDPQDNLCRPWGIACDKEGHIIVADRSNNRIQIYFQDGTFLRRFGTHGTAPGQFDRPAGVAVDARRRIVVADKDNHRIQVLTMEGLFLLCFGEKGCRAGQFNYPWDVAANSECQIVVSDTRNHRVQLFSPEGVFLRKYGYESAPNMWKHFDSPRGVAFNPDGNVVTTDFNNHRLVIIDSDFVHARVLECESPGAPKQFLRPQGLVIDDEGNIIVADSRNHRIQIFDSTGTLQWRFGNYGKDDNEMDRPSGIALCPDGRIVIVDFGNNRVLLI